MYNLCAQVTEILRIKAGEVVVSRTYRFPNFIQGVLHYKNGNKATALFNFHILSAEMQFINAKGDTLVIEKPNNISSIVLDTTVFYYKDGYMEAIADYDSIQLARKLRMIKRVEKIGGYGMSDPASAIESKRTYTEGNAVYNLGANENIVLLKDVNYYFIDKNGNAVKANKSNLFKLFPGKKTAIEKYLAQMAVDFSKREDIARLLLHIVAL